MGRVAQVSPRQLRAHPSNSRIYSDSDVSDLAESIRAHGVLEPLVATPSRVIVSGHRRLRAARQLGLTTVPVETRRFADETLALVEFNRYRRKTYSELYRELEVVLPKLRADARDRQRQGGRNGALRKHGLASAQVSRTQKGRTALDEAARLIGLSRERTRKLLRLFEAVEDGAVPPRLVDLLDAGEVSLHEAYRKVLRAKKLQEQRNAVQEDTKAGRYDVEGLIKPFDVWYFHFRDRRFGFLDPDAELLASDYGSPPPQVWANLLWYFTEEGDRVIDLTAGSGAFHEVAIWMKRRPLSFDISPRRPFIRRHDMTSGFPQIGSERPKLIVADPPYGDQRPYSRSRNDLSRCRSTSNFLDRLERVIELAFRRLAADGHLAVIVGNAFQRRNVPDLSWEVGRRMERHGRIERRILVPYPPTHFADFRVAQAKKNRQMLSLSRELFVARPLH